MGDPSLALSDAIRGELITYAPLQTLIAQRVYDQVPANASFPYVTIGDGQVIGDDVDCADRSEIFFQIHVWSRAVGYPEIKNIVSAIRTAMKTEFLITGLNVTECQFQQIQWLKDPDGLTRHAMVEFRFLITHTS